MSDSTITDALVSPSGRYADQWADRVGISFEELADILGVDPKAQVQRVWVSQDEGLVFLWAASPEPIEPGKLSARGGRPDLRIVRHVRYEPKPARYFVDVGITQDPTRIYDRASGETFVSWGNLEEIVEDVRGVLKRGSSFGVDSRWAPGVDVDAVGIGFGLWQLLLHEGIEAHRAPEPTVVRKPRVAGTPVDYERRSQS